MSEQAIRVTKFADIDESRICYWFEDNENITAWFVYIPRCGAGCLLNHKVVENSDGTITVTPSILTTGHDKGIQTTRHGYLTNGIWNDV